MIHRLEEAGVDVGQIARALTEAYALAAEVSLLQIGRGVHPTYLVRSGPDRFVVRAYASHLRARADVLCEAELLRFLGENGAPVSAPVRARGGELLVHVPTPQGGAELVLSTYVPGEAPPVDPPSAFRFGASLARVHEIADGFSAPHEFEPLDVERLLDAPARLVAPLLGSERERDVLARIRDRLGGKLRGLSMDAPAHGLCHGDAHHLNALADERGAVTLFDFELVCRSWRAYDLATAIWGTLGRGGNQEVWSALVQGYGSVRLLGDEEAASITTFMASRHVWWMGFHARNWGKWRAPWLNEDFFPQGMVLLRQIVTEACGLDVD